MSSCWSACELLNHSVRFREYWNESHVTLTCLLLVLTSWTRWQPRGLLKWADTRTAHTADLLNRQCSAGNMKFGTESEECNKIILMNKVTGQAVYIWRNTEARSSNHCCRRKALSIKYSWVSVALVIQHAKRMRLIILLFAAYQALPCSSTLCQKKKAWFSKQKFGLTWLQVLPLSCRPLREE